MMSSKLRISALPYSTVLLELRISALPYWMNTFGAGGLEDFFEGLFLNFSLGSGRGSLDPYQNSKFSREMKFKKLFRNELDGAIIVTFIF